MYGCRRYYFDWKTDGLDYYKDIGSNSSGVNDCRSDHQSFADIDVNTGTDTYIYTEDHRGVCWNDLMWFLDVESVVRFHGKAVE